MASVANESGPCLVPLIGNSIRFVWPQNTQCAMSMEKMCLFFRGVSDTGMNTMSTLWSMTADSLVKIWFVPLIEASRAALNLWNGIMGRADPRDHMQGHLGKT